MFGLS